LKFLIEFKKNYRQFPYKKLINRDEEFRIRIGGFRIIYKKGEKI
jgi:mRNA-degrading endonuclease RelE of RelBE toxin-antitoxin system